MNNIFQYVLFDRNTAHKNIKSDSLVYSPYSLYLVYQYTKALENRRLLQLHSSELSSAQGRIKILEGQIDQLKTEMKLEDQLCKEFKPLRYLDSVAESFENFLEDKSNKQLYPRMLRRRLNPCFKELHTYQFYDENYSALSDGAELLLKSAYHLRKRISVRFQIDCDLPWEKDGFDFKLVTDYFRVLENLKKRRMPDAIQLPPEEVARILTDYFSSSEATQIGVQVIDLNLNIISRGYTVERLTGEAFVVGRNPEEFVTVFESSDSDSLHIPQYVTVVTGPHYGNADNRDVFTVKIENEDSLKVVVDEWFKSGED